MKQSSDEKTDFCNVFTQLKSLGVKVPKIKKFKSSIPKQAKSTSSVFFSSNKLFGISISEQEQICVEDFTLPKFIVTTTDYLGKFSQKEIGLFRKAGSVSRQRDLRIKLENGESIDDCEPNDVASLLKQWLRELPEPLIPVYLQDLFVRCHNLQVEENRVSAVLLCCHLLPVDHFHTFKHLLNFLSDIAKYSQKNKMGAHNLAVIMAPNIFVMGADSIDKFSNTLVQQHTSVIELLINNAHRVGLLPPCPSHLAEAEALKDGADLDLSLDALDYSPSKSKKKRRSGPVQDLFTGIRKLVGQNSLSPNPKRSNQENSNSDTRSASKRKADPEHLPSMSPLKKKATASAVLQSETSFFTPTNKITQSFFGGKDKNGSAHSRRKSFGLLRRKEKKRKNSSKSNLETKLTVSTPDPFQEKLVASLQEPIKTKESIFDKSPLLSPIDIENLFSKSGIIKKSVSDCYLTVQNEIPQKRQLSSFSSEGCLRFQGHLSPYNLRSSVSKKAVKRKSDELNRKSDTFNMTAAATEKENGVPSLSPMYKNLKNSPMAKRRSQSPKSPQSLNSLSNNTVSPDQNNSNCILKVTSQTNSLKVPDLRIQESYCNKKVASSMKTRNSSLNAVKKSDSDINHTRSDIKYASVGTSSATSVQSEVVSSTVPNLQTNEKVIRKCSISRQDAFIIKPKNSRKNTLNQLKRADSIKISKSRNSRTNHQNDTSTAEGKTSQYDFNSTKVTNSNIKKKDNTVPTNTSDRKHIKRSVRNGSIVRGRPNTVRTGLPSDVSSRYNNESSVNTKSHIASTSSVDNDLFIEVLNQSEKNDPDLSVKPQIQNITLSPKDDIFTKKAESKNKALNCVIEASISAYKSEINIVTDSTKRNSVLNSTSAIIENTDVNDVVYPKETKNINAKIFKTVSKRKTRGRLCSNSDSKIHIKKRSSKVSRVSSFPEPAMELRPRKVQKLRAVKSASPRKSLEKTVTIAGEIGKENLFIEAPSQSNLHVKTPETDFKTPETWVCGRKFFDSKEVSDDDNCSKRESIAMITKNLAGHVRAKASFYDCRSTSATSTPMTLRSANPSERFCNPHNLQSSQKRNASVKNKKSTRRNSPLPPPPKFVIPDSPPIPSYPLKELTNLSNSEDKFFTPSPGKRSFSTPSNDGSSTKKRSTKCTLKPKMKSYSGHTPFKLPVDRSKVFRSESSPLLPKVANKSSRKSQGSSSSPNSTKWIDFSPTSDENCFVTPVSKTRSSLSIEKLRSDQLLDEWNCEM